MTLIELMVTLAIMAIVASVAIPSYRTMITRHQLTSTTNEVLGMFQVTRSEAIKRNQPVILSVDPAAADSDPHFWIWHDTDGDSVYTEASDELIRQYRVAVDDLTIAPIETGTATPWTQISFLPDGMTSATNEKKIRLCNPEKQGRFVRALISGSTRAGEDTTCP